MWSRALISIALAACFDPAPPANVPCAANGHCASGTVCRNDVCVEPSQEVGAIGVNITGTGNGSVSSSPGGITCPSDCEEVFADGATVTLDAIAADDSTFDGWSGACEGADDCVLVAGSPADVSATFTKRLHTLTISRSGTGGDAIVSSPPGIDCGSTCAADFEHGTQITLDGGVALSSWAGGGCSGTGPCTITLVAPTTIAATYGCTGSMMFQHTGAAQTFSPPTCAPSLRIDAYGAAGGLSTSMGTVGLGGRTRATIVITPGEMVRVNVGGAGGNAAASTPGTGGFNGGGGGANSNGSTQAGGGGGGASDVRIGGTGLAARVVVAAGGGAAASCGTNPYAGGNGGGTTGADAPVLCNTTANTAATGGSQTAGGAGGKYTNYADGADGAAGAGGAAGAATGGGGGGGGYFGGGGGSWGGGAGGSSYAVSTATDVMHEPGVRAGDGLVIISW